MTRNEFIETCRHADALLGQREPVILRERVTDWLENRHEYASGVEGHDIRYAPSAWTMIEPWPAELGSRDGAGMATVTRGEVFEIASGCAEVGRWDKPLVASSVWGYGRAGYGQTRLAKILESAQLNEALTDAIAELRRDSNGTESATRAYQSLLIGNHIKHLGPAFFTKLLYFAGEALA